MSAFANVALAGHAGGLRVLLRQRDHVGVVFDALGTRPRLAAVMTVRPSPEPRSIMEVLRA